MLATLDTLSLRGFADRVAALPGRFDSVMAKAAALLEPEAQFVHVPRRTLKTAAEIDAWAQEASDLLNQALHKGPVVIQ